MRTVDAHYRMSARRETIVPDTDNKSAPVALQRQARGLADRKDTDRLMATVEPCADTTPDPWALVDGCPSCVVNVEPPWWVTRRDDGGHLCAYSCTDCGHNWSTNWGL